LRRIGVDVVINLWEEAPTKVGALACNVRVVSAAGRIGPLEYDEGNGWKTEFDLVHTRVR
jgi:hypothetical protein